MAKILELVVGLSCVMQGQPDAPFMKAAAGVQKLQDKLKGLQAQSQQIKNLDISRDKLSKLEVAQQGKKSRYSEINKEIAALVKRQQEVRKLIKTASETGDSKALKNYKNELEQITGKVKKFKSEKSRLVTDSEKLSSRISQESSNIQKLRTSLEAAGISTGNLTGHQSKLAAQMDKVRAAQDRLTQAQARLQQARVDLSWQNIRGDVLSSIAKFEVLRKPVTVSMDFSSAMSALNSVARLTKEQYAELEKLALKLGADTQFSNTQAVQTMDVLSHAGWNVDDIKKGISHVLDMAAAEGLDLREAGTILSEIILQMGTTSDKAGDIVDMMAFISSTSATNIRDIAAVTMKFAGIAKKLDMTPEQVMSLVGGLAKGGMHNDEHGTALRNSILSLYAIKPDDKKSVAVLRELGIDSLKTRDGHLREFTDILLSMSKRLDTLDKNTALANLSKLFGERNANVVLGLADSVRKGNVTGVEGYESRFARNEHAGWAHQSAEMRNDNLRGDLTRLSSAMEGLLTRFGKPLEELLRPIVDTLTQILSWINNFADKNPTLFKMASYTAAGGLTYGAAKTGWNIFNRVREFFSAKSAVTAAESAAQALEAGAGTAGAELTAGAGGASQTITAGGTAAGGSLIAGSVAIGGVLAICYGLFKNWQRIKDLPVDPARVNSVYRGEGLTNPNIPAPEISPFAGEGIDMIPTPALSKHASGGIFTTPHLGLVAEAGAEAIIPLTDKTRGTGLLIQAAEKLGLIHESSNTSSINNNNLTRSFTETNNIISREVFSSNQETLSDRGIFSDGKSIAAINDINHNNKQFAPVINISVNAGESESRDNNSLGELIAERVKSVLDEINNNFMRLEYA